jgi:hypothetical protein
VSEPAVLKSEDKPFTVGDGTPGPGRPKGLPNKFTVAAKQAFSLAFEGLGGVDALIEWGKENRSAFYTLYARLIPMEVAGSLGIYDASSDARLVRLKLVSSPSRVIEGELAGSVDGRGTSTSPV